MMSNVEHNKDHWQQMILEFRAYLQNTIELLPYKKEIRGVETPLTANPRKAKSRKQTQPKPDVKQLKPVPPVPAEKQDVTIPSKSRRYSSPLWVGLGDDDPGRSNSRTKQRKNEK